MRNRILRLTTLGLAIGTAVALLPATAASAAPSLDIDFTASGYSTGSAPAPGGQNGWVAAKTGVDWALVDNTDFPASGLGAGRSLRFSNASVVSGGAHLVSPLIDPAGDAEASNTFSTTFTLSSATGALQPGLAVDVAIDGASRYGGVLNLRHTSAGLEIGSYWVPESAPDASLESWRSTVLTTVDPAVPHTITWTAIFLPGQADYVQVLVDGRDVSAGSGMTTWEFYHSLSGSTNDRSVDSLSFKTTSSAPSADGIGYTSIPAAASVRDNGFLFSGISYGVSTQAPPVPTAPPVLAPTPTTPDVQIPVATEPVAQGATIPVDIGGFAPFENVYVTFYSTPVFGGWFQADAFGRVVASIAVPAGLAGGTHTLQLTGASSGFVAAAAISVAAVSPAALAAAGPTDLLLAGTTATVLLVAGLGMMLARRRGARQAV